MSDATGIPRAPFAAASDGPTPPEPSRPAQASGADEFYVGYLPAPPRHGRYVRRVVVLLAALVVLVGFVVAAAQSVFGPGAVTPRGRVSAVFYDLPVPLAFFVNENGTTRWLLLVGERKFASSSLPTSLVPAVWTDAPGVVIGEPGAPTPGCLEIGANPPAQRADIPLGLRQRRGRAEARSEPLGRLTLRGQIIDPKCHFGAMKPGEGKVHRACAVRCISGGIPPVLMVRERSASRGASERLVYYILVGPEGEPVNDAVLEFVAENVEITGEAASLRAPDGRVVGGDTLRVLRFDPKAIRRAP